MRLLFFVRGSLTDRRPDMILRMLAPVTVTDVDEAPNPPQWRGAKQLSLIAVVTLLAVVVTWIAWRHLADTRYESRAAAERARHEPLALTDFERPVVAGADNAATYWKHAIAALPPVYGPSNSNFTFPDYPPFPKQWFDLETAAVAAHGPAIQLSLEAAKHRQADWGPPPPSPFFKTLLPNLNLFRELANEVGDASIDAHFKQQDAEAIRRAEALLDLSDDIADRSNSLIEYLVAVGIRALSLSKLQIIAGNLQFGGDQPGGATAQGVRALIDRLNDASLLAAQRKRAMLAERADGLDTLQWASDQQPLLRPLFTLWGVRLLDLSQNWLAAADAPNQPMSQMKFSATAHPPSASTPILTGYFFGLSFRILETGWRVASEQRMVTVNLALHLYEHDRGAWPASLDTLKPDYLKTIPADPYAADGRSIGYIVLRAPGSKLARPMLYVDTTPGAPANANSPPTTPCLGWSVKMTRQWRDVAAWQLNDAERHLKLPNTTQP